MSKKTGRKIDINIDFKVNQIAEPDINQDSGCDPGFEAPLPQEPETPPAPRWRRRPTPPPPAGGQAYAGEIRDNAGDSLYNDAPGRVSTPRPGEGQAYAGEIMDNAGDSLYNDAPGRPGQPVQQYGQIMDLAPAGGSYDDIQVGLGGGAPADDNGTPQDPEPLPNPSPGGGNFGGGI